MRKRRFFRRRFNGKLSKKHYTWVTALNTKCGLTTLNHCVPGPKEVYCCPSQAQLVLLDNTVIQSSFQDSIRVVRVHGQLGFNWNLDEVIVGIQLLFPECEDFANAFSNYMQQFSQYVTAGIAVREVHNGDLTTLPRMNPTEDFDFSEGRWKMMRFHTHPRLNSISVTNFCDQTSNNGVCSSVTGASPGATTTVCTAFPLPDVHPGLGFAVNSHVQPWKWSWNSKCSLGIRENQLPVMSVGWAGPDKFNGALPPPRIDMVGSLKLLIEVG